MGRTALDALVGAERRVGTQPVAFILARAGGRRGDVQSSCPSARALETLALVERPS